MLQLMIWKSYHEALVKLEKCKLLIISGVKAKIEPLRLKGFQSII